MRLTDTDPKSEEVQVSLLRSSTVGHRLTLTFSLSHTVIQLSKRAIRRANPGLNGRDLDVLFVKYHYGGELAERLRDYLDRRK